MIKVYETKKDAENLFDAMRMDEVGKVLIITKNTEYKDFIVQEGLKRLGMLVDTSVISIDEFYIRYAIGAYKFLSDMSMRLIIKKAIDMNLGSMPFLKYPSYIDLIFEAIKEANKKDIDLMTYGGEYKKIYLDYEDILKKKGYLASDENIKLDDLKIKEADSIYFIGFNELNNKLIYLIGLAKDLDKKLNIFIEPDFASDELISYLDGIKDLYCEAEMSEERFAQISKNLFNEEILDTEGIDFVRADSVEAELDYVLTDIKRSVLKSGYSYEDALIYLMDKSEEPLLTQMLDSYHVPRNKNRVLYMKDLVWQDKLLVDLASYEGELTKAVVLELASKYTKDEVLLDKFTKIMDAIYEVYGDAISKDELVDLLKLAFKYEVYRRKDRIAAGVSIYNGDFDTLREYKLVYVLGMSLDAFPKTMSENFLLDSIYKEINYDKREYMPWLSKNLMKKLFKAARDKITISYSARTKSDADQGASSFFNEFSIDEWTRIRSLDAIEKSASLATNEEQKRLIEAHKNISKSKLINYDEINKLRAEGVISKYNGKLESYSAMSVVDDFVKNKLTVSFLETFKTCPYAALLSYIYDIKPVEQDMKARNIGTYMHKVLELYYRNFIGTKVIFDEEILERCINNIKSTNEYADVLGFELENIESYIKDFIIFDEERMKHSNYIVKDLEKSIKISVDGHIIKGKIDRVDEDTITGKLLVIDYKRSKATMKDSLQLSAYALYYKPSGADIDAAFVAISKFDGNINFMPTDADACEEEIKSLIEKIKTYSFNIIDEASEDKCLMYCEYRSMCKKGRE